MWRHLISCFVLLLLFFSSVLAQKNIRPEGEQCLTIQHLKMKLATDTLFRSRFETEKEKFNKLVSQQNRAANHIDKVNTPLHIPVVFHIVLPDPNIVTDAQIIAQLD